MRRLLPCPARRAPAGRGRGGPRVHGRERERPATARIAAQARAAARHGSVPSRRTGDEILVRVLACRVVHATNTGGRRIKVREGEGRAERESSRAESEK
eukprot:3642747-Pleurochrysis_carterae.AAC.1